MRRYTSFLRLIFAPEKTKYMYKIIRSNIYGLKISMKRCFDHRERVYYHPFINDGAISTRLAGVLLTDYAFDCTCQENFPNEFFKDYYLVRVWPTPPDQLKPGEEIKRYVTSNIWYSCKKKPMSIPEEIIA